MTVCLVVSHLLVGCPEVAASPSVLTGDQGAVTPVPEVVLQHAPLGHLRAGVGVGADDGQLV